MERESSKTQLKRGVCAQVDHLHQQQSLNLELVSLYPAYYSISPCTQSAFFSALLKPNRSGVQKLLAKIPRNQTFLFCTNLFISKFLFLDLSDPTNPRKEKERNFYILLLLTSQKEVKRDFNKYKERQKRAGKSKRKSRT